MPEMEFNPVVNNLINCTYTMEAGVRTLGTAVQGGLQAGEEIEVLGFGTPTSLEREEP